MKIVFIEHFTCTCYLFDVLNDVLLPTRASEPGKVIYLVILYIQCVQLKERKKHVLAIKPFLLGVKTSGF